MLEGEVGLLSIIDKGKAYNQGKKKVVKKRGFYLALTTLRWILNGMIFGKKWFGINWGFNKVKNKEYGSGSWVIHCDSPLWWPRKG